MRKSLFLLLIIKLFYCFYGVFIFGKITYLGDAISYLNSPITLSIQTLRNNTLLISSLTAILKKILFLDFFVHLAYCLFSFWGLTILIKELKWSLYKEYILVFFSPCPALGCGHQLFLKKRLLVFLLVLLWSGW